MLARQIWLFLAIVFGTLNRVGAESAAPTEQVVISSDAAAAESTTERDEEDTTLTEESEANDIIPPNANVLPSTGPITPTSVFIDKKPYEQAIDELAQAHELWSGGHIEAASDLALEAYDDLMDIRRSPGVKRQTILSQRHKAAALYVESAIATIQQFVKKHGKSREAVDEGRARLEDVGEVARGYPELRRMLNSAIEELLPPTRRKSVISSKTKRKSTKKKPH